MTRDDVTKLAEESADLLIRNIWPNDPDNWPGDIETRRLIKNHFLRFADSVTASSRVQAAERQFIEAVEKNWTPGHHLEWCHAMQCTEGCGTYEFCGCGSEEFDRLVAVRKEMRGMECGVEGSGPEYPPPLSGPGKRRWAIVYCYLPAGHAELEHEGRLGVWRWGAGEGEYIDEP